MPAPINATTSINATKPQTRAGLAAARVCGKMGGRKRKMTELKVISAKKFLAAGTPPKDVANHLTVSIPTLYRWIPGAVITQQG